MRDGITICLRPPPALTGIGGLPAPQIELFVDPNDFRDVPFSSLRDASYELLITRLLHAFGSTSRVFLDVGSNIGFYCALLAKSFPELIVHGVELISLEPVGEQSADKCPKWAMRAAQSWARHD